MQFLNIIKSKCPVCGMWYDGLKCEECGLNVDENEFQEY